jgi:hypothetical protein
MKTTNQKPQGKVIRFPGIVKDAKGLNVTRIHLYLVLTGLRESRSLITRYQTLKGGQS